MVLQKIEKQRQELSSSLPNLYGKTKLFNISSFYSTLLSTKNNYLIQAYVPEFIDDFISELNNYTPFYQSPERTEIIIALLEDLKNIGTLEVLEKELSRILFAIKSKLEFLIEILNGHSFIPKINNVVFPLIELFEGNIKESYGSLESVSIKINHAKSSNKFVFVPSDKKVEDRLLNQTQISFQLAVNYFQSKKHKFHNYHEVLIYFENLSANYQGESLGVALTICFIEQLSLLYNLPYITNIKKSVATTGSVYSDGLINSVGKEAIERKVETVFYSQVDTFIIPKKDEHDAKNYLTKLKLLYAGRKLRVVAIEDMNELLNRRDLVEIKKQNKVVRAAKGIRRNWIASALFLLLLFILIFNYLRDFDNNPAILEAGDKTMFVKNKSGKILWTRAVSYSKQDNISKVIPNFYHLIEDINNDGINEVIVSQETFPDSLSYFKSRIACFDYKGSLIWQSIFKDTVKAKNQIIDDIYNTRLIGIVKEGKRKVLLCSATNGSNFPSAVYKLDALNGNRIEGTLWNPGHIMMGLIRKKDNGKHEIVCNMYNNDYERTGIFGIDYENLSGTAPYVKEKYRLLGLENAKLNYYILVPNTDYNKYYNNSNNSPALAIYDEKRFDAITFSTYESPSEEQSSVGYEYKYKTADINVVIISYFKVRRDFLVASGKLKPPFSDTPEYKALLKSQVLYWNGKRFVSYKNFMVKDN